MKGLVSHEVLYSNGKANAKEFVSEIAVRESDSKLRGKRSEVK
jgi:hypothetical protein